MKSSTLPLLPILIGLSLPTLLPQDALACGLGTHGELANRGLYWFESESASRDYDSILAQNPEAFQAGAPFPDWGYACGYGDAAEDAHWQPFLREAAGYVHDQGPGAWDQDTERLVAFLFGVTAHSISDISWHGLDGVQEGFLDAMAGQDFYGSFGDAHTHGDAGGDMIAARELGNDWLVHRWYVPIDDVMAIYERAGHSDLPPQMIERCVGLLYLGTLAESIAGTLIFPYFATGSPFLTDQYLDYFIGGLDDMAIWSAWTWGDMATWIEEGPSRSGDTYWAHGRRPAPKAQGSKAGHLDHPTEPPPGLALADALGLKLEVEREGRGLWLSVDPESLSPALKAAHRLAQDDEGKIGLYYGDVKRRPEPMEEGRTQPIGAEEFLSSGPYAYLGKAMTTGDYNGDGRGDLILGAHGLGTPSLPQQGAVYVQWGAASVVSTQTLSGVEGAELPSGIDARFGQDTYGRFGFALATADVNADGIDDLVVGAPTTGGRDMGYEGAVHIFLGGPRGILESPDIVIEGEGTYSGFGSILSSADVNGDGFKDLIAGSPFARAGGRQVGEAFVFLAQPSMTSGLTLSQGDADWRAQGQSDWSWFGASFAMTEGDDGEPLLLIGSPGASVDGAQTAGRIDGFDLGEIEVGLASSEPVFTLFGENDGDKLGHAMALGAPIPGAGTLLALGRPGASSGDRIHAGMVTLLAPDSWRGERSIGAMAPVLTLAGEQYHGRLGWALDLADINGDGVDDLTLGEPLRRTSAGHEGGAVHLIYGGASFPTGEPTGGVSRAGDKSYLGSQKAGRLGQSILAAGDGQGLWVSAHRLSEGAKLGGGIYGLGR